MRREIDRNEQHPINLVNASDSDSLISEGQESQGERDSSEQNDSISLALLDESINKVPIFIKHENDKEDRSQLEGKQLKKTETSYSLYGLYENKTFSRLYKSDP